MSEKSYRNIKIRIKSLFERIDQPKTIESPPNEAVRKTLEFLHSNPTVSLSPLVSFLSSTNPVEKWGAVTIIGRMVARHAGSDLEWARTVIRRFMWYLNDESGGIGWGIPEAMGEILRYHHGLAVDYGKILWSYIDPGGNHLENDDLVEGTLWGIARVATAWRDVIENLHPTPLTSYIYSTRPFSRLCAGVTLLCFQKMGHQEVSEEISMLGKDKEKVSFFWEGGFLEDQTRNIILNAGQWILWAKDTNTT